MHAWMQHRSQQRALWNATKVGAPAPASDLVRPMVRAAWEAPAGVQTKLAVSSPGDSFEQEADRISEQVMRTPEPRLQRACACGGGCPRCQTPQPGLEHERLQTKRAGSGKPGTMPVPPIVDEVLRSPGYGLDRMTRAFMEPRFGQDFSRVRVHTGEPASRAAREIDARAFTCGRDVVFGSGEYAPGSRAGRQLLAHELVHTLQQESVAGTAAPVRMLARQKADEPKPEAEPKPKPKVEPKPKPKAEFKPKADEPKPKAGACPTFKSFNATKTGTVGMKEWQGRCELLLGNPGKSPGMTFTSQLDIPQGCEGTLQYVQLVKVCRESKSGNGDWFHTKTDNYWLDRQNPYEKKDVASDGNVEFKTEDSPGQPEGGVHIAASDMFRMYLLWQPKQPQNAPLVPLAVATWSWSGAADRKSDDSECAKRWTVKKHKAAGGKGKPTKDLPTWTSVYPDPKTIGKGPGNCA